MASDFWASSHCKRWILTRFQLAQSKQQDIGLVGERDLQKLRIYFSNYIHLIGKRMDLRMQVIATAIVFFKRFYSKNSFCECDPYLTATTCVYLASKVEECPVYIRNVANDREVKNSGITDKMISEFEFLLLEELEFNLVVFHPYRSLIMYLSDLKGERTNQSMGLLQQHAWYIINDSYRSDLSLLYPPHQIAIAAIFMACVMLEDTQAKESIVQEMERWFVDLRTSYDAIIEIVQEILSVYHLWGEFVDEEAVSINQRLRHYSH